MGKEKQSKIGVMEGQIIKHKGLFDFDGFLKGIEEWFSLHKYDFFQKAHSQKKTSGGGYLEATWVGSREVTEYVKYTISIDIWLRDLNTVAIEENGETKKINKGNLEVTFNSAMEKDYQDYFSSKGKFGKFIKEVYEKYIAKSKLQNFEDKLFFETKDFYDYLNKFLKR